MSKQPSIQQLAFLYRAARTISAHLSTDEVLQGLMELTHQHFHPDAVSVAQIEADGTIVFCAASGKSAQDIVGMRLPPGTGIVGWVAAHGETLWIPDVHTDPRFYSNADKETGFHTDAILAAPVRYAGQTLAVLEMLNPAPDTDLETAEDLLIALGTLAARAIQNARLFEQVQRAEARYQSLFEQNRDPIIILDQDGQLLEINRAAQHLFQLLPNNYSHFTLESAGMTFEKFQALQPQVAEGDIVTWEFTVEREGQPAHTLEIHFSHLPDYPPTGVYHWLAHDITDRVALAEMRQSLSHMIVHDLRAPLSSILNSLELTLTAWREKDIAIPIEQVLKIGVRSAHRMERLISTILDTSSLQADEKTLNITTVDITYLVNDIWEIVYPIATRRQQTLTYTIAPDTHTIQADVDVLRRVLINIINNATKYTRDGSTISLTIAQDDTSTCFAIQDNGPGLSENDQHHIFDMFYRGHNKQPAKGTGLGLAFCQLAVEAHGGKIWLESTVGEGTTFYFTIPHILPEQTV